MKLMDFHLLVDENIDPDLINHLRNQGFNVKDVHEAGLIAAKDTEWLELAKLEERVIITQDNDFGRIVFTQSTDFIGIIFLRPGSISAGFHIQTFNAILSANPDLEIPFMITAKNTGTSVRIKIRQLS